MITLYSIHRNLISLYQHRYIVKKISVENFGKRSTRSNEKFKWHQSTNKKQAACKIISWVTDKRITIHSAKISIYFLQNSKCIINILAEEVGEHWKREVLSLKEGKFQKICTFFPLYIKNAWTWYLLCNGGDFVQRFKRNKNRLHVYCLEEEKRQIWYGILLSVAMN